MCVIKYNGKRYSIEDVDGVKVNLSVQVGNQPKKLLDVFDSVQQAFEHIQSKYGLVSL
jgi:hypothetical protein